MKQIHFFALKDDLLPVLESVELAGPLKYILMGHYPTPAYNVFAYGVEIPNLGKTATNSASNSESFLVAGCNVKVNARPIMVLGTEQYAVDQLLNPDSITFTPGGIWNDDIILSGRVATVSDSSPAQEIMKRFHSAFKRRFTKVRAFLVGPEALALLNAGKRLTYAAQCPPESDLKIT